MRIYDEEVWQRTRLAVQARYKRRPGRGGCRLPSDRLTDAQLEARSGPVVVLRGGGGKEAAP